MKKQLTALFLALLLLLAAVPAMAASEWMCLDCKKENDNSSNFCIYCGAKKPEWTCKCGKVNIALFCANCGTSYASLKEAYETATENLSRGQYELAEEQFAQLGYYSDSPIASDYAHALALNAAKDYAGAVAIFLTIKSYKDVDSLLVNDHNLAAAAAREACTKVGSIVTYGHYEQDNNTGNGKEAIDWIVLKYDSTTGRSLLLSQYGLDAHRFDASTYYQGWDKSEIRSWLNSTFLSNAFTAKEQEGIATTTVKTGNNAEWVAFTKKIGYSYTSSLSGGADTQDKVFLLSLEEAMEYGGYSTLDDFNNNDNDKMMAIPTKYAIAQGAYQSDSYKLNGTGCCCWWLRSPGCSSSYASYVLTGGSLGSSSVYNTYGSVRPAFWLNLDSADIY